MELRILGTAAAEGWPGVWCVCDACARARELGGKNIRTRTSFMLGERIKIDYGPDAYAQMLRHGLDFSKVEHLLITHSHEDHFYPTDLLYRDPGLCWTAPDKRLLIHSNSEVEQLLRRVVDDPDACSLEFRRLRLFEPIDLGDGIVAIAIRTAHMAEEVAVNYLLGINGRWVLQGNDTGWYPEETWEFLADYQLGGVILDCTFGPVPNRVGHLGIPDLLEFRDQLAKQGSLKSDARFIANHFSHRGGLLHEELEAQLNPYGVEVAYDGMVIEV